MFDEFVSNLANRLGLIRLYMFNVFLFSKCNQNDVSQTPNIDIPCGKKILHLNVKCTTLMLRCTTNCLNIFSEDRF